MKKVSVVAVLVMACLVFCVITVRAEVTQKAAAAGAAKPSEEQKTAEETKVTGAGSLGAYNRYIFRGYEIGKSGLAIQPALMASYKGLSASFWGNIDTNPRNTTSAVFTNERRKTWDETDLTLSYTYAIKRLSMTGGYIYYNLKYAEETEEVFLGLACDILTKPTLSIYQDINAYKGTYLNLSFAHSFPLPKDITLDLGASFGYFVGESHYWRTFEEGTGDYTGSKYKGFHDGMAKAGLTIPVTRTLSIQPVVQYWFPLSGKAKKTYGRSPDTGLRIAKNPNGYVVGNLVYGVGLTYGF